MRLKILLLVILFSGVIDDGLALTKKGELAEKMYLQGSYQSAAYECERLFNESRDAQFKNEVAQLAGLCYLKLNDRARAQEFFEYVMNNAKDTYLLEEAKAGLENVAKAAPPPDTPSYYAVQVGCFKDRDNATRLFNRFKRRRYTVRVAEEQDGSVTIFKVKIGRFKTREEAVDFARKLEKIGHPAAIVPF